MKFSIKHLCCAALGLQSVAQACTTDDDCSLNGVCGRRSKTCTCDPGWTGADCSELNLLPATRGTGYNLTASGTSSWGSKIIQDPKDRHLYHLFAAEFEGGCGLDDWSPFSRIIRAESRTGPAGPYTFVQEVVGAFAHNPTVVYSPADRLYLLYHIGCPVNLPSSCQGPSFSCGPGNDINGESGITVRTSRDLKTWTSHGQVWMGSNNQSLWDADLTNPSPFPLYSPQHPTAEILLVYRGCGYNCENFPEQINVASAPRFTGPYSKLHASPVFQNSSEDPFVWRDKRGHFHMLLHSIEPDGGFGSGPKVGRHAYARTFNGEWTFNSNTLAFSTNVEFTDGTTIDFYRRERPQLFFSDDGEMRPLYLTTGVQEVSSSQISYSVIQPISS
ncbi:hypothetical protein F5884DRAFT_512721 [Xylogone sp. PMI_703]|nr:hypothetical protein F5884DRAFT_512721 [Xylogone sp. PMI_703]